VSAVRATRRGADPAQTLGMAFLGAIAVHIVVALAVNIAVEPVQFVVPGADKAGAAAAATAEPDPPLEPTCVGDAVLAAGARGAACVTPFAADPAACFAEVAATLAAERARCVASADPLAVQIVSMTPQDVARIDPEPMLELLDQVQQEKLQEQMQQQQQQQVAELVKQEQQRQQQLAKQAAQVVETARPSVEVAPDNARFLSDYDTKTEKETVARGSRKEDMVAKSSPEELAVKDKPREAAVAKPPEDRIPGTNPDAPDAPGKLSMRAPGAISPGVAEQQATTRGRADAIEAARGDGYQAKRGDGSIDQQRVDPSETRGATGGGGGTPQVPDLHPSKDVLERAIGGGSVDHLEEVDSGDETSLNAKRWVHASFFNRLKRQVAQNWEPAAVWRRHDPSGAVYGFKSRVTQLRVSLDARGKLAKPPTVIRASGVDVLDDEAVRAFEAAAPFPNPPDALVQDGMITFEFSFHFEIGAPRTSWRVLKQM
jgi:TonB family protein